MNNKKPSANSDCAHCEFYDKEDKNCPAYPMEIPDDILTGKKKHRKVLDDQCTETTFLQSIEYEL